MVSAFSSGTGNANVKLGRGSYIWQALWDQARAFWLAFLGRPVLHSVCVLQQLS